MEHLKSTLMLLFTTALVGSLQAAQGSGPYTCPTGSSHAYCATKLPPNVNGIVFYTAQPANDKGGLNFDCANKGEKGEYCCKRNLKYADNLRHLVNGDELEHGQPTEFSDNINCKLV
ncbi:hypothetical protein MJO28_011046 [Puccinia striiformis f. sp. tritici]|uniref:Hydrophobin n=5 Tax=Puccinia striiformis TaxID=27350 RepID=A0A0L0VKF2_9BASI|nr:hypothetical protein Pst134EB_021543 [Puccinia striiformis f. sp. tritici]KAI7943518.1 hypothetical protein MJO28_011046 [Puccinia striiformis f. sp. tritici]KNE99753.1 hypothetical protein PSTG_07040 [Puccinia striiformis f. sp. tritici PST-78]POW04916.1 hypothetical protein PSTT_10061 [Puccinia striiformis]POW19710.1 hypothetical protein PSHT_04366 [Puccinia striiformis]